MAFAIETALGRRPHFQALGTDYDTRDGTCVRDFVHVLDLADAHSRAIQHLLNNGASHALNLGTGHGTTVKELLETVKRVAGRDLNVKYGPRRQRDSPILVADSTLANRTIGEFPAMILRSIIDTAWNWHLNYLPAQAACRNFPRHRLLTPFTSEDLTRLRDNPPSIDSAIASDRIFLDQWRIHDATLPVDIAGDSCWRAFHRKRRRTQPSSSGFESADTDY